MTDLLPQLIDDVRHCRICETLLPLEPKPILQIGTNARLLVVGQAPGIRAHESATPFNDPSGDRLRNWLGVTRDTFYDSNAVALLPMAFCYPGTGRSGDRPPPKICAQTWREALLKELPRLQLTVLCGTYAIDWHLNRGDRSLTEVVSNWREYGDTCIPIPHPSGRNNGWLRRNPWFEADLLPELRERVATALRL